jgi:hypothetical protein
MRKRKKTRNGSRAACAFLMLAGLMGPGISAGAAEQKEKPAAEYSIISGSVFREPGFALPQAEVTLQVETDERGPKKSRKLKTETSPRGEFTFRVPFEKGVYTLMVAARGFARQQKRVEVQGRDRIEVTFMLAAESNK